MRWRTWTAVVLVTAAVSCSDGGDGEPREVPLDCRNEVSDGCFTLITRQSAPGRSHFHLAATTGELVDQYGITHTLYLGPGSTFTRPMKPGVYVLYVYRGSPPRGQAPPPIPGDCVRKFELWTGHIQVFRVEWRRGKGCEIVPARGRLGPDFAFP
jgi:hypothetical protein